MIKQKEDFLYLQWYLALTDPVKTTFFVDKWGSSTEYKNINKLNIFFTNKKVKINLPKILQS